MEILVLNSGSSSLKMQLFRVQKKQIKSIYKCLIDAIGMPHSKIHANGKEYNIKARNHQQALRNGLKILLDQNVISSLKEIELVGHRVVHGGTKYQKPVKITTNVISEIKKLSRHAPLHNPANLAGIVACRKALPRTPQIAVFDTAFHQSIPEKAHIYGLPLKFYKKHGIRKYGFHGISHHYVTDQALKILKSKNASIITCHLGNGCSITASKSGKSADTSMGYTPLEGTIMGTRSGTLDPTIPLKLQTLLKKTPAEIDDFLNHDAGLKGLSGISSDYRLIDAAAQKGNANAKLTIEIYAYSIAKEILKMSAALPKIDAIVFTAGIGENSFRLRKKVCENLHQIGVSLDNSKNLKHSTSIHDKKSKVKVMVIPTNEELMIANLSLKVK